MESEESELCPQLLILYYLLLYEDLFHTHKKLIGTTCPTHTFILMSSVEDMTSGSICNPQNQDCEFMYNTVTSAAISRTHQIYMNILLNL